MRSITKRQSRSSQHQPAVAILSSPTGSHDLVITNRPEASSSRQQRQNPPSVLWRAAWCVFYTDRRSLYFQTIVVFGVVFLLAGLANLNTISNFRDIDYSNGQGLVDEEV